MTVFMVNVRKKALVAATIAAALLALTCATAASADVVTFHNGSCTIGSSTQSVYLVAHPAEAYNPLQVVDPESGELVGVLVPQTIYLNGDLIGTIAPGLESSAVALTACTFLSSRVCSSSRACSPRRRASGRPRERF